MLEQELLQLPEEFGGYGLLTQLFNDPQIGNLAQQLVIKRQFLGLDLQVQQRQEQEQQLQATTFTWKNTLLKGPMAPEHVGLFAFIRDVKELQQQLLPMLRLLRQRQQALRAPANSVLMLSFPLNDNDTDAAAPDSIATEVAAAAAAAEQDPEAAEALKALDGLRLLMPTNGGDAQQITLIKQQHQQQQQPSASPIGETHSQLQEDLLQRLVSLVTANA